MGQLNINGTDLLDGDGKINLSLIPTDDLNIIVKKGTAAELAIVVLAEAELGYTTDTKAVYVGDGITLGGVPVGGGGAAGIAAWLATPSSANLATAMTDETGSGALVFATSPTLVTPNLGTPTSGTLTNTTGLPISTGVAGLGTGVATFLGTPSSANLATAVTDETGSGSLVFATSPTLVTPALGTPSALVLTNATGLPASAISSGTIDTARLGSGTANSSTFLRGDQTYAALTVPTIATTAVALKGDGAGNAVAITNSNDARIIGSSGDANATIANTTDVHVLTATFTAIRTLTLPAASSFTNGRELTIATLGYPTISNYLKLIRGGSDTLNGSTSDTGSTLQGQSAAGQYYVMTLRSDGVSKWFIIGGWSTSNGVDVTFHNSGSTISIIPPISFTQAVGFSANPGLSADSILTYSNDNSSTTYQVFAGLARAATPAYVDGTTVGALETNNGATRGTLGRLKTGWVVTAQTSNYTVLVSDKGTFFTNAGAAGTVNFTLPTAAAGLQYSFYIDAAQTLTVTAGASTTIRIAGSVSAAAGNISASTVGNCVRLMAISATSWVAESHEGTWTVT